MKFLTFLTVLLVPLAANASLVLNGSTASWTAFGYSQASQADFFDDQQTGLPEGDLVGSDLVGSNINHLAYWQYDGTDFGIRVRVGASLPQPGTFDHALLVAIDQNLDGDLDLFFGADNSGSPDRIRIWNVGAGGNTTAGNTSIGSQITEYVQNGSNYDFSTVSLTTDPTASSFDIDNDGNTDWFVSFSVPFADLESALPGLTDTSLMRVLIATSTQTSVINQDIGGVQGGLNSTTPWVNTGGLTDPFAPVPEPSSLLLLGGTLAALLLWKRRYEHRRKDHL